MDGLWNGRRWGIWAVRTLGGVAALVVVLLAALLLVQAHLKDPIVRYVAAQSQRQIRVDGAFQANILSLHPRITADGVVIGNPSWMPPGQTAEIGHLELTYALLPNFPFAHRCYGARYAAPGARGERAFQLAGSATRVGARDRPAADPQPAHAECARFLR